MKLRMITNVLFVATLLSCGEDTGRRRGSPEIFVPGITTEDNFITASHLHRNRESIVLTSREERDAIAAGILSIDYRTKPSLSLDDEGKDGSNVRSRSTLGRPATNCGLAENLSITARIENCSLLNSTAAVWDGTTHGASGESLWRLVAREGTSELWLDTRTGHLWSDTIVATGWCNASGALCPAQTVVPVCSGASFMGLTGISWRLPTRNDYLQADLDGLRFVLKPDGGTGFWTATIDSLSPSRNAAWVYQQTQGTLEKVPFTSDRNVRCIGAAPL